MSSLTVTWVSKERSEWPFAVSAPPRVMSQVQAFVIDQGDFFLVHPFGSKKVHMALRKLL